MKIQLLSLVFLLSLISLSSGCGRPCTSESKFCCIREGCGCTQILSMDDIDQCGDSCTSDDADGTDGTDGGVVVVSSSPKKPKNKGYDPNEQPNEVGNDGGNGNGGNSRTKFLSSLRRAVSEDPSLEEDEEDNYANFVEKNGKLDLYDISDKRKLRKKYRAYKNNKKRLRELKENEKNSRIEIDGEVFESSYGETQFMDYSQEELQDILDDMSGKNIEEEQLRRRRLGISTCGTFGGPDEDIAGYKLEVTKHCRVMKNNNKKNSHIFAATGQAECNYNYQRDPSVDVVFKPQHILDCAPRSAIYSYQAWQIEKWANTNDYCYAYQYPWDGKLYTNRCGTCSAKSGDSTCWELSDPNDNNRIARAATTFSMAFQIWVTTDFLFLQSGGSGTPLYQGCSGKEKIGGHWMYSVGQYNGALLLVKNYWGTSWGKNGYAYIRLSDITGSCQGPTPSFTMNFFGWS